MSDLQGHLERMKLFYVDSNSLRLKDLEKHDAYVSFSQKLHWMWVFPVGATFWQASLTNVTGKAGQFATVKAVKWCMFVGALTFGFMEYHNLNQKWRFLNRYYPEATQYQRSLETEAQMFKEQQLQEVPYKNVKYTGVVAGHLYDQMYQLPKMVNVNPDWDVNAADIKERI